MTFSNVDESQSASKHPENESEVAVRSQLSNPGSATLSGFPKDGEQKEGGNVNSLVAKSKKAASTLWTLLHAKNCRLGVNRCSHPGCSDAKLIYLHMKTCSAQPSDPCPTDYKGCCDARKLLAHYRRCRDIRSRQAANISARQKNQQHICLVCCLVARNAKGALEIRSSSPKGRNTTHLLPALKLAINSESPHRRREEAHTITAAGLKECNPLPSIFKPKKMPPPPPRFPFSKPSTMQEIRFGHVGHSVRRSSLLSSSPEESIDPAEESKISERKSRPRSESLDIRYSPPMSDSSMLKDETNFMAHEVLAEEKSQEIDEFQTQRNRGRRRSLSCSVPSSAAHGRFDPIDEEPVGEDLQSFLERDS